MRRSIHYSQNFLHNQPLIEKLIASASFTKADTVLDIGAGSGSITRALAACAGHVIAYEADERLAAKLVAAYVTNPNVEVVMGDFLAGVLPVVPYKVFANIPFNRTSDIAHKLLDGFNPLTDCYLILQREAALKFAGTTGHQSLFSALHAPWLSFDIAHTFHARDFTPMPKVTVVLLHIRPHDTPLVPTSESETYKDFVSYLFNHANPNIFPALKQLFPGPSFAACEHALGPKLTAKPSQLELHDWVALFRAFLTTATAAQRKLVAGASTKQRQEASLVEKHHRTRQAKNWREV